MVSIADIVTKSVDESAHRWRTHRAFIEKIEQDSGKRRVCRDVEAEICEQISIVIDGGMMIDKAPEYHK